MTSTDITGKPFKIEKRQVYEAYKAVKSNKGAAGVDGQTLDQFDADLEGNLYKIWNRMSSGSYFPPAGSACRRHSQKEGRREDFRCSHSRRSDRADGGQAAD